MYFQSRVGFGIEMILGHPRNPGKNDCILLLSTLMQRKYVQIRENEQNNVEIYVSDCSDAQQNGYRCRLELYTS
jgi:hypothetical protein